MKIAIVGAGIVGIATAWELVADGHEVVVFERRGAAAEEASFANAGLLSPGRIAPWGAPGLHLRLLRSLLGLRGGLPLRRPLAVRELAWIARWQHAVKFENYLKNRLKLQHLALHSQARQQQIVQARELEYERGEGSLLLLRGPRERKQVEPGLALLRNAGIAYKELDAEGARKIEPALCTDTELAGAIHLPGDETGNCRQFALLLRRDAEALGAQFHFNKDIAPLSRAQPRALSLAAGSPPHAFDAVVVCAGLASAALLRPLGVRVPLAPVYGYSISAPIREMINAPRSAVIDERHHITIARFGQRVRVAGGAELGGRPGVIRQAALQPLYKALADWFPGAANLGTGLQQWKGARPMLPDGVPLIGPSGAPGVWLNLGHGDAGWALACGSARWLADQIAGRDTGIAPPDTAMAAPAS